jgi:hypothetical protein
LVTFSSSRAGPAAGGVVGGWVGIGVLGVIGAEGELNGGVVGSGVAGMVVVVPPGK